MSTLLALRFSAFPFIFLFSFFFFNDTATTEIYTLSLHDALPILDLHQAGPASNFFLDGLVFAEALKAKVKKVVDRKSTRLNSSHPSISYAVFCLKKKKKKKITQNTTTNQNN